jgi:hypothetical protein
VIGQHLGPLRSLRLRYGRRAGRSAGVEAALGQCVQQEPLAGVRLAKRRRYDVLATLFCPSDFGSPGAEASLLANAKECAPRIAQLVTRPHP